MHIYPPNKEKKKKKSKGLFGYQLLLKTENIVVK